LTSREIDEAVRQKMDVHEPLYILDKELLRREQPDVILTQDLCRVCAVPSGQVQRALDELGTSEAKVVSLDPHTMDDVIGQIEVVGSMLDRADRAKEITGLLRSRVARVKEIAMRLPTLNCSRWIGRTRRSCRPLGSEMVEAVGGVNLLNAKGEPSKIVTWRQVRDENPEVIVFMPCGYYLEEAEEEGAALFDQPDFADTPAARNGNVFAVDAT
jgi:iron complex transport system substrate-binding protein